MMMIEAYDEYVFTYEAWTLLRLDVSGVRHRHTYLHLIIWFSQIISGVGMSMSCPMSVSVLHRFSQQESMLSDSGLTCIEVNFVFDRIVSNTTTLGFVLE